MQKTTVMLTGNTENKKRRHQHLWTHGNGRKAERKGVFRVGTGKKTTVMQAGIEKKKSRKKKRNISKHLDTWER